MLLSTIWAIPHPEGESENSEESVPPDGMRVFDERTRTELGAGVGSPCSESSEQETASAIGRKRASPRQYFMTRGYKVPVSVFRFSFML